MEKISDSRIQVMLTAIELGVDVSDFSFYSITERVMWRELEAELTEFFSKHGATWIALAA